MRKHKYATCTNCERPNMQIVTADGMCAACNSSGLKSGAEKGSPEYLKALADAKTRLTNPDTPLLPRGRAAAKIKEESEASKEVEKPEKQSPKKKPADIMQVLLDRRHELMNEVFEINKAISTIEKYSKAA